ncbi:MAG: holo-ACP synthase [Candidatus Synoicihabitans palmerolidicus]|nr:holo-ACP synthase [Candidatus Synoicihabitans palmerolidicus]
MINLPAGGICLGLGCDLIEVDRIRGVMDRQGEWFLDRVFTAEERTYCEGMKHPHKHYAARFAAKEAVSKCFTTGIGRELGWKSISVWHGARHEPKIRLDEAGTTLLQQVGGSHVLVSLSHTETAAMAVAAIVSFPTPCAAIPKVVKFRPRKCPHGSWLDSYWVY